MLRIPEIEYILDVDETLCVISLVESSEVIFST